ncbi:TetR/AcrR family transcriptional regulator [Micromonospora coxensis]|uniref:TetR/AcrR family transcriptional regulator n=1 Tax=Micromonospora coxensis TaxID=356852 RepID=UPI00342DCAD3
MVPKLWSETVEAHRAAVRGAILDAAARLVAAHGLTGVTMSALAGATGIGRATLYKYFPDVEHVLVAWHERQVDHHLEQLSKVREQGGTAGDRLEAALAAFAGMTHRPHGGESAAALHRGEHVAEAHRKLAEFFVDLLTEAAHSGAVRDDVAPQELALYCLHALGAAISLPSRAAVTRLVAVTMAGLRPAP